MLVNMLPDVLVNMLSIGHTRSDMLGSRGACNLTTPRRQLHATWEVARNLIVKMAVLSQEQKLALAIGLQIVMEKGRKRRRIWTKQWLSKRTKYSHMNLLQELKSTEPADFQNYLRMDDNTFATLLELVRPRIEKQDTIMREPVSAEERLVATLRFLATGRNYEDLKFSSIISPQLLGKIIPETCRQIYEVLKKDYLKMPSTPSEWAAVAEDFRNMWQIENCLGSIDGKHIAIKKPSGSGSYYYNYKGFFSVVLLAVVNAKYEFLYIHTGSNGRVSDGGILQGTDFYDALTKETLNVPPPRKLPGMEVALPYVFIGDAAFPLQENIMKPYPQRNITHDEKIFNYRLSRARRVVENAFGILSSRFGVFQRCFSIKLENVDAVVLACCALHNYLLRHSTNYLQSSSTDFEDVNSGEIREGDWRREVNQLLGLQSLRGKQQALLRQTGIRDLYKTYYNSNAGSVPFQEKMISRH